MALLENYLQEQFKWSISTFGRGNHTSGLIKHLLAEIGEITEHPDDMEEWIDVAMLALDGALRVSTRTGKEHEEVLECLYRKLNINRFRKWNLETGQHIE